MFLKKKSLSNEKELMIKFSDHIFLDTLYKNVSTKSVLYKNQLRGCRVAKNWLFSLSSWKDYPIICIGIRKLYTIPSIQCRKGTIPCTLNQKIYNF